MVECGPAQVLRAAAASHVITMHGVAGFESGLCQTPGVPGGARALQPMHQNQFPSGWSGWSLGMYQDLNPGFSFEKSGLHGKTFFVQLPLPVVAGDGKQVRIPEERNERGQELS